MRGVVHMNISEVAVPYFISNYKQIHNPQTEFSFTYYHTLPVSFLWFTEMRSSRLNWKHIFKWMTLMHTKKSIHFARIMNRKLWRCTVLKKLMTAINPLISLNKEIILLLKRHDFWSTCMQVYARVLTKRCTTAMFPHPVHSYLDIKNYDIPSPPSFSHLLPYLVHYVVYKL